MSDSQIMVHRLLEAMGQLGRAYDLDGNFLQAPQALMPSSHALNSRTDVQVGAASVLLELYRVVCQSAQGREALRDLGFEPFFEQVERPEGSGFEN